MTDPTKLRALAMAATPGPWRVWTSNSVRRITGPDRRDGGVLSAIASRDGMPDLTGYNRDRDLEFIAACDPTAILALLDSTQRLEAEVAEAKDALRAMAIANAGLQQERNDAREELARLRPVYEAAVAWRDHMGGRTRVALENAIKDAIDAAKER